MQLLTVFRIGGVALMICGAAPAFAQQWNDPRATALVRQATERRTQQLADSGLLDYQAIAHGYLTFLAQLGEGFREPPKVVKADELALQVYWHAPNLSKQLVIGRRDTTVLPTDIQYHRDHLGIVQNNFPSIIRLGEGDEVADVPHPLSPAGLADYDFALSDSLRISIPGRVINVYELKVRPRDDRRPRLIGALYLDRDNAQVVRMAFSFTRASYLDKQLEDVFIVLENGLVGTRFWLPRHQEVEIRRTARWLDYPVRGIIRGRWEISDYQVNTGRTPPTFTGGGSEIVFAPPAVQRSYPWSTARILDSLPPDVRAATAEEIRRVQVEARALVREQALRRARGSELAARGVSDFARFNRVEGAALGAGLTGQLGAGVAAMGYGRYGTADRRLKGGLGLRWQNGRGWSAQLGTSDDYEDTGDVQERSLLMNSFASQEFGSDYTDLVRVTRAHASVSMPARSVSWTLDLARERQQPLAIHATSAQGRFERPAPADTITMWGARLVGVRPTQLWLGGLELRWRASLSAFRVDDFRGVVTTLPRFSWRGSGDVELERPIGESRFASRTIFAAATRNALPQQQYVYMGGPVTAPGYDYHTLVSRTALAQRVELRFPAPFVAVPLGRFGRSPATMTLAPFATVVARGDGVFPSVGSGALLFFDILRVDVARGLRRGRWAFYFDVNRAFWSVL